LKTTDSENEEKPIAAPKPRQVNAVKVENPKVIKKTLEVIVDRSKKTKTFFDDRLEIDERSAKNDLYQANLWNDKKDYDSLSAKDKKDVKRAVENVVTAQEQYAKNEKMTPYMSTLFFTARNWKPSRKLPKF
jgi:hypothetical protein